jgi:hypothetical protein
VLHQASKKGGATSRREAMRFDMVMQGDLLVCAPPSQAREFAGQVGAVWPADGNCSLQPVSALAYHDDQNRSSADSNAGGAEPAAKAKAKAKAKEAKAKAKAGSKAAPPRLLLAERPEAGPEQWAGALRAAGFVDLHCKALREKKKDEKEEDDGLEEIFLKGAIGSAAKVPCKAAGARMSLGHLKQLKRDLNQEPANHLADAAADEGSGGEAADLMQRLLLPQETVPLAPAPRRFFYRGDVCLVRRGGRSPKERASRTPPHWTATKTTRMESRWRRQKRVGTRSCQRPRMHLAK